MRLHENEKLFKQAVSYTAQQMGIPPIYVEKDYWVTFALYTLFNSELSNSIVFKGGTALSKCFGFIERFSEDIDLVVLQTGDESGNALKKKLKAISEIVSAVMPEVEVEGVTHKMGMIRKTAHGFKKIFRGDYGQVRKELIVESSWLGYFEPYHKTTISSYIHEMIQGSDQVQLIEDFGLHPFEVTVLDPKRTICEKIMSLVRFSYSEDPALTLGQKVRHFYDLNQLLAREEYSAYFDSPDFEDMLLKVAWDDTKSFKNENEWLEIHPQNALLFSDPEQVWTTVKKVYENEFRDLVYGTFPPESDILATLNRIANRLKTITWDIKVDKSDA